MGGGLTSAIGRKRIGSTKEVCMTRVVADCRRWPSDTNCSLTIIGEPDEVVRAAAEHAASVHGHEDTPELRDQLRDFLEPAEAYSNEPRAQEPMSG
jgi:predicted small metal-binding protein